MLYMSSPNSPAARRWRLVVSLFSRASAASAAWPAMAAGTTTILLAHQPNAYELAEKHDVHLQLSGHTHGGQYVPFNVIGLFMRYFKGLYRHDNGMWIYVNAGTGFWGPPLRTGNPAEVTLLILRRG